MLTIEGSRIQLTQNDGKNHLHGGGGLSFAPWETEGPWEDEAGTHCVFRRVAPHGMDGYPGNRQFTVAYTLAKENSLLIRFRATTDRVTWVNLSNHAYWNLSGDFARSANGQLVQIASDAVYENDAEHLPLGTRPVEGTAFDFRAPQTPAEAMAAHPKDEQLRVARGYNHTFVLRPAAQQGAIPAVTLAEETSGRRLRLYTDYPAVVLYTGGFLHEGIALKGGGTASPSCALALEPQELPGSPACLLRPGETRERFIRFTFDALA